MKCWPAASEPARPPRWLYSGDTGFYSGAAALVPKLRAQGAEVHGAARDFQRAAVGRGAGQAVAGLAPCQRPRMCLRPCGRVPERPPDLFSDGRAQDQPAALCEILAAAGLARCRPRLGRTLAPRSKRSSPTRRRTLAGGSFAPLSVLLVEPCPNRSPRARPAG